ncbi:FAD/NAD(P)-binding protein [Actinoplanes sp. NPDC049265]|uniref:FAD/NAD(P)-binding protein n=1 Tax=Actinoplanes sp. NPDC049265 TaxID=3363902 RepID=UPI003719DA88
MSVQVATRPTEPVFPWPFRVVSRRDEAPDTVTLELVDESGRLAAFAPGQFAMLTAYGIGEVPISLSAVEHSPGGRTHRVVHTVRAVGAVTRALCDAEPGAVAGVRGPFGTAWDLSAAEGRDAVIVAGGIGLAPVRPIVDALLRERSRYGEIVLLAGARTPPELLYPGDLLRWADAGVQVAVTVDRPSADWTQHVGVVPALIPRARFVPSRATAFVCGPEIMMRFAAEALTGRGVPAAQVQISLERNMRCGTGWCGHCQLGPLLVCRDGPVVGYDRAEALLKVREL